MGGKVTKVENGWVTLSLDFKGGQLHTVPVEDAIVDLGWWLHKIRVWMKAVDPTYNDFVSDYVARADFQRMKREQVEARKAARQARQAKKQPTR